MTTNSTRGYAKVQSPALRQFLRHPAVAVASHWVFQSLFYMDTTERLFKMGLDIVLTIVGAIILHRWLPWVTSAALAFLLAHTVNFLLNGQVWGVLKHYGYVSHDFNEFNAYVMSLKRRVEAEPSIRSAVVFGSVSRDAWSKVSDLDARLVRQSGFVNGMRACTFLALERTRAFFRIFPLDMYVVDSGDSFRGVRVDEPGRELGAIEYDD